METGCSAGQKLEEEAAQREREWEEAAEAVAYDSCTWPPPVVAVCGPGNSGKSAFSRLLLNTLIERYKKVGYLDIDVGQPEFTPPGFVSLHVFEEKPKDLTILYLCNPKRCFFFGDICAKRNPKLLLTYIFGLHDYFLQEFYCLGEVENPKKSAIPLVINTSGWVKGTGLQVLTEMLKYVSPSHVIRVSTTVERKNLPGGMFWMNEGEGDSSVNLVEIPAAQNSPRHLLAKKEARIIRDLRLIAYFRQCLPREFPVFCFDDLVQGFGSIHPFRLPLSKIHVIDLHCQVSLSGTDVQRFLNGTTVGVSTNDPPLSTECSTPCCIGLGFIKAIDISEDCIYLITPISHKLMEKVDILFLSCIAVPSCLLQVSDTLTDITDRLREL
ncbi:polynucleotide 5'-hydroxyl-kinase NOL9-like [Miscanthus floridulus]|uniref:polynucleotide 5'-hydroxyl-kinase NOL9-like n=1 Tax=Miscanthus floridulus TaxID=154761 RepID=UPI00345AE80E